MEKTALDLLYLATCAVTERAPAPERVAAMDFAALWPLAKHHKLTATAAAGLGLLPDPTAPLGQETWQRWQSAADQALRRALLFEAERAELLAWFDSENIWYVPLKGILIQTFYPRLGMREMADNDLLFAAARAREVRQFMQQRGYTLTRDEVHDEYTRPPVYNFEFHLSLFHNAYTALDAYYRDVEARLVPDGNGGAGRALRPEDMYVYVSAHAYKHYAYGGGTGLRTLVDSGLYCRQPLDWAYIDGELAKLGILDFDRTLRALSAALLAAGEGIYDLALPPEQQRMLDTLAESGAYGGVDRAVEGRLQDMQAGEGTISGRTKLRYLWGRLFPPRAVLAASYPIVNRAPVLLPLVYVYRLLVRLVSRGAHMRQELRALKRAGK